MVDLILQNQLAATLLLIIVFSNIAWFLLHFSHSTKKRKLPLTQKGKQESLHNFLKKAYILRDINEAIRSQDDFHKVVQSIVEIVGRALHADRCILYDYIGISEKPSPCLAEYCNRHTSPLQDKYHLLDFPSLLSKQPLLIINRPDNPLLNDLRQETFKAASIKNLMGCSMNFHGETNGSIFIHRCSTDEEWTFLEKEILQEAAEQITLVIAMERMKKIKDLELAKKELEHHTDALIKEMEKDKKVISLQSEFVAMVSHQFRTPLAIIGSSAEIIERQKTPSIESLKKQTKRIKETIKRMDHLVEKTLDLSKLESGEFTFQVRSLNPAKLIEDITLRLDDVANDVSFALDLKNLPSTFKGDKSLLEQVFMNLLSNAVKYSNNNDVITVKGSTDNQNNRFEIAIQDSGIGIPDKDLDRLFEKFFRARNAQNISGTGIGLYLVKQLIELHDGDVEVDSTLGEGTVFKVSFPLERVN